MNFKNLRLVGIESAKVEWQELGAASRRRYHRFVGGSGSGSWRDGFIARQSRPKFAQQMKNWRLSYPEIRASADIGTDVAFNCHGRNCQP